PVFQIFVHGGKYRIIAGIGKDFFSVRRGVPPYGEYIFVFLPETESCRYEEIRYSLRLPARRLRGSQGIHR
ncbi:hypothetical protein, partial [Alistipes finegoldii]|uniref:hypothetical protein n=1 Tax=Alistipes finegoldii TaxID=214856 RepID=UPI003AF8C887